MALPDGKKVEDMFSGVYRIPACGRQTDGQTDGRTLGQTDIFPRHSRRYVYASRGKIRLIIFMACFRTVQNTVLC